MNPLFRKVYKSSKVSLKMFQSDTWSEAYRKCLKIFLNKWSHWTSSSQADERTMHNLEMDPLPLVMCLFLHPKGGFWKALQRLDTLRHTFHLQLPPGTRSSRTAKRAVVFVVSFWLGPQSWCTRSLTRNSALLGFPAWFCTQKQLKQFSWHGYWNLEMLFPKHIDLGTSAFHPLLFVPSYVLPAWYNLDLFFNEPSLSALKCHCVLLKPCQPVQSWSSFARKRFRVPGI